MDTTLYFHYDPFSTPLHVYDNPIYPIISNSNSNEISQMALQIIGDSDEGLAPFAKLYGIQYQSPALDGNDAGFVKELELLILFIRLHNIKQSILVLPTDLFYEPQSEQIRLIQNTYLFELASKGMIFIRNSFRSQHLCTWVKLHQMIHVGVIDRDFQSDAQNGNCVDVLAPGKFRLDSTSRQYRMSEGAFYAAGVAATYLRSGLSTAETIVALLDRASANLVNGSPKIVNKRYLYLNPSGKLPNATTPRMKRAIVPSFSPKAFDVSTVPNLRKPFRNYFFANVNRPILSYPQRWITAEDVSATQFYVDYRGGNSQSTFFICS
jgi:hypothetical protein